MTTATDTTDTTDTGTTAAAPTKEKKPNPFKAIAKAAGVGRPRLTEGEKWNNKSLRKAIVSLQTLATGERLVSAAKQSYRKLNAGTTVETVFQLLKQGVSREVISEHAAAGELAPLASRYDWASIFATAEENGVSLFKLAEERKLSANDVAHLFGFVEEGDVMVVSSSETETETTTAEAKPAKRKSRKAA